MRKLISLSLVALGIMACSGGADPEPIGKTGEPITAGGVCVVGSYKCGGICCPQASQCCIFGDGSDLYKWSYCGNLNTACTNPL